MMLFKEHKRTDRSIGDDAFIDKFGWLLGQELKPKKPEPEYKKKDGVPGTRDQIKNRSVIVL
jgi:hypothetical protein